MLKKYAGEISGNGTCNATEYEAIISAPGIMLTIKYCLIKVILIFNLPFILY